MWWSLGAFGWVSVSWLRSYLSSIVSEYIFHVNQWHQPEVNFIFRYKNTPFRWPYLCFCRMRTTLKFNCSIGIGWVGSCVLIWEPCITWWTRLDAKNRWMCLTGLSTATSELFKVEKRKAMRKCFDWFQWQTNYRVIIRMRNRIIINYYYIPLDYHAESMGSVMRHKLE